MKTEEFVQELGALVVARQDREALDLASRLLPTMASGMTSEQITRVADLMHGAEMAIDLEEATAVRAQAEAHAARTS
jgi:hypothetical protein